MTPPSSPCAQCSQLRQQRSQFQSERDRARNRVTELEVLLATVADSSTTLKNNQAVLEEKIERYQRAVDSLKVRLAESTNINSQLRQANHALEESEQRAREALEQLSRQNPPNVELEARTKEVEQLQRRLTTFEISRKNVLQKARDDKEAMEKAKRDAQLSRQDAMSLRKDAELVRQERDSAIQSRDVAIQERDEALRDCDLMLGAIDILKKNVAHKEKIIATMTVPRSTSLEEDEDVEIVDIVQSAEPRAVSRSRSRNIHSTMQMKYVLVPPAPYSTHTPSPRKKRRVADSSDEDTLLSESTSAKPLATSTSRTQPTFKLSLPGFSA